MGYSPMATAFVPADKSNYTVGRAGNKIDHITVHHMAGIMSAGQCGGIFQRPGRGGSSNYGIGVGGEVACYVDEDNMAWCDGNRQSNRTTVSIETSNSSIGGDWPVSDASYNTLCKLVADIAKRNGLGTLVVGKNLFGHKDFAPTACPGPYLYSRLNDIANRANAINGGSPSPSPVPTPAPSAGFLPPKGYWGLGDNDARVGQLAYFMRSVFPLYTPKSALGDYYGPNIKNSIREFQRRNGLEADGNTGPITYGKLKQYGFRG